MRHLFSFKKKDVFGLLLLCAIAVSSCTNEDEVLESNEVEPGIYMIEMTIDAQINAETRGVQNNNDFDTNYEYDYIYLHNEKDSLMIPVYNYCEDCVAGLRYVIEVYEDGSATLTPIDENGSRMEESLAIPENGSCYFSSWESCVWKIPDDLISTESALGGTNIYYQRRSDINQELYRSVSNYTISDLATNGDLALKRACAGFNVVGLFYDGTEASNTSTGFITLTSDEFSEIMGDEYTNWYIKIYIGGDAFMDKYNLSKEESVGVQTGGYYSTGDAALFQSGQADAKKYLQFTERTYGSGEVFYTGFGYYTISGNHLFTPVTGETANVYVMIKHWTGSGDPDDDWLLSDTGAIYTAVDLSGTSNPVNNSFYTYGLLMNIEGFKTAWDAAGGDNYAVSTRGLSLEAPREFFLKDAKVICESY